MFGVGSVRALPEGVDWPAHWPKHKLGHFDFRYEYRKWIANPDTYTPPDIPAPS